MMRVTVEISDEELRKIVARHIADLYDGSCKPEDIRFAVVQGYNGEMGDLPTPNKCSVIYEASFSGGVQAGGR